MSISSVQFSGDDDLHRKNSPYRSARRSVHQERIQRASGTRHLTVRSDLRKAPDVRKIARAIIALSVADAERAAQAERTKQDGAASEDSDV